MRGTKGQGEGEDEGEGQHAREGKQGINRRVAVRQGSVERGSVEGKAS